MPAAFPSAFSILHSPVYLNAHCHLELSALAGKIRPGKSFPEWLNELVPLKRALDEPTVVSAARANLAAMHAAGTTALCDIISIDWVASVLREAELPGVHFRELIRFQPEGAEELVEKVVKAQGILPRGQEPGLSPHAPYTITARLLAAAADEAARRGQWLCIHAAETPEETAMLLHGRGSLREFLGDARVLPPDWRAPGMRPVAWLAEHGGIGPRTLLVHCNDLDDRDVEIIRRLGASVVVCPGTHVYFDRGRLPLATLLGAGIPCYLGTDSLASNEALDMAREIRLAQELSPAALRGHIPELASVERLRLLSHPSPPPPDRKLPP